ncbi:ABC transporter permease [Desertimonas flava]|uniref:ABC transporter permease n=1 Tax=Desertimonas flava TaxID=2064846 RepID=UPI000E34C908|nr:ABC transporter permease [Desertimonas flava]
MSAIVNIVNSYRSEWILLNRRRMWMVMGATTVAFTVLATIVTLATAEDVVGGDNVGFALSSLVGSGGATAAVVFSIAFSSILVLAAFASSTGNEFGRGTLRSALTRQPNRSALIAGKLGARVTVASILMLTGLAIGALTSAIYAPTQDISTDGWFDGAAFTAAVEDYGRLVAFVVMYALIGTTIAVLVKSTPVALGIGLLWFGPIENVIGENREFAERWFPGLVLRSLTQPDAPDALSTGTALATLGVYAAVCVAVIGVVLKRRDVTA